MLRVLSGALEPIWVIECTAIDSDGTRKSFERKKHLSATVIAKMNAHNFSAAFRGMFVDFCDAFYDGEFGTIEDRFDHVSTTGRALAELAMAHGQVRRLA